MVSFIIGIVFNSVTIFDAVAVVVMVSMCCPRPQASRHPRKILSNSTSSTRIFCSMASYPGFKILTSRL
jgi:hypothetical protein